MTPTKCMNPTCPVPGLELPDGATKCWRCGAKVETAATQEEKEACVLLAVWRKEGFGTDTSLDDFLSDNASKVKRRWLAVREAARAPLEAEVARLRETNSKYAQQAANDKNEIRDLRAKLDAAEKLSAARISELEKFNRELGTRLDAAEKVSEQRRLQICDLDISAERRQPVDRERAIAAAIGALERWSHPATDWHALACRDIVDAILGTAKAEAAKLTTKEAVAHICRELQTDECCRVSWVANIAMQFNDRLAKAPFILDDAASRKLANDAAEGVIDLLCKDAPKPVSEETIATPPAFVPSPTGAEPSDELLVQLVAIAAGYNRSFRQKAQEIYQAIALDHAAQVQRVRELERQLCDVKQREDMALIELEDARREVERLQGIIADTGKELDRLRAQRDDMRADAEKKKHGHAGALRELENTRIAKGALDDEIKKLQAAPSKPCPADGMSDWSVGKNIRDVKVKGGGYGNNAGGKMAREPFGKGAK